MTISRTVARQPPTIAGLAALSFDIGRRYQQIVERWISAIGRCERGNAVMFPASVRTRDTPHAQIPVLRAVVLACRSSERGRGRLVLGSQSRHRFSEREMLFPELRGLPSRGPKLRHLIVLPSERLCTGEKEAQAPVLRSAQPWNISQLLWIIPKRSHRYNSSRRLRLWELAGSDRNFRRVERGRTWE